MGSFSLARLGRFSEAANYEAEALGLVQATQHANTVGMAHYAAGVLNLIKGDSERHCPLIERALAVFRAGHVLMFLRTTVSSSAWVLAQLGDVNEAHNRLQEGRELGERLDRAVVGFRGWADQSLGRTSLLLGRLEEARDLGERAIESSPGHHGFAAHALHLLGDIAIHPDQFDAERGEAHYRQALALAEPRGMRPLVAHCHLGLGRLHGRVGRGEQACEHLSTATSMYREMGMRYWLAQAEAELHQP